MKNQTTTTRWKTDFQQQLYSSKLLQAISHVRRNPSPNARTVRQVADRALAVAAKGRTRWSQAILKNKLKLNFKKRKNKPRLVAMHNKKKHGLNLLPKKKIPALQQRVNVLGKLVPGCRKESFPVILEEATDYIAALEMQIRAMTALANLLSSTPVDMVPVGGMVQFGASQPADSGPVL
ncbi:hypothetical protein IFM89_000076 [Coptis chinensis]|uniref:BHLH domain-containing protein n=1 Tax=Coptis chinensis TaxID=261450 RepID=A0A835IKG9_9MAGN|nr:hypothetical protein IFM89_000076 [Coptis chinensis]